MIRNEFNSLAVILIYGSLVLLSFLTIANPKGVNKKANVWFGIFLFLWSSFWIDEIIALVTTGQVQIHPTINIVVRFIQFFTPIVFYMSVVFFTNPNYKFKVRDSIYFIFPILFLIGLLLQFTYSIEKVDFFHFMLTGIIILQILIYVPASYLKIKKHQKHILLFSSDTKGIDLNWLEKVISLILIMSITFIIYNIFFNTLYLNLFINTIFFITILFISYYSSKQKEIFPLDEKQRDEIISIEEEQEEELHESKKKLISDEELVKLKTQLTELMHEQKPYLDSELNLIKLATLINITPHQLSYLLNWGFNENFFQFINKYRVEKAKELLLNKEMNYLSMLGIAFESGFNSKTSFNTTFKKITNQTPSEFKKNSTTL